MEGKGMQKWSQSITEQWKNLERVMEKEREWKDKIKGMDWSFGAGCTMDKSVAWAGSLGRGSIGWLLGSKGAVHMVRLEGRKGVGWAGNVERGSFR